MDKRILVLGASGQIGTELTQKLRELYGNSNVVASDIKLGTFEMIDAGPFEIVDATDKETILSIIKKYQINQVYLLAAMLSATAEKFPQKAWNLNMNSLLAVLELAKEKHIQQIYWPSSIAVFGPTTPKNNTPQKTIMEPSTVYGISKLAGEFWCNYYHEKFGVDVRSLRYPGIISWKTKPGGGTTDYAVDIYFKAVEEKKFTCFLSENTRLPMMYMEDAVNATIQLMEANPENIKIRTSYNLSAIDVTPKEIANEIKKRIPDFTLDYVPDSRQQIADSWPSSIDDSEARKDWNWKHEFDLQRMTFKMLESLKNTL
ncbi:MAG: NAD-dependent epimerase/dehydratase family protein [Flavobacteriia bacterium]|nr:NAD-dependent epimerase/dehydratase family protein [Flavobacteriia bacterium]OIP47679.1 MAG: NAD-dependent epimerase [Flavobacteriaceae bacterium CG2_30_31_66]PIV97369.1 MAG: NAD-dependent epimerase [Flavobacteriaceae bacterium CG17_big_fil_post_rev_8_21_14_2_50_31_13]PIX14234.1 MAG: NAD-dependent epimerase [Flavobacteriaceae bacterium CG_4_8_14_3_um_filter_31_8]PIY14727.1 MAG: NAD-dependent epimerase [Flavobacteriaceae bacterium CG_4_10_14_3_um_filter_31_253]PIZ12076.1 MAG: NAD-dependent e